MGEVRRRGLSGSAPVGCRLPAGTQELISAALVEDLGDAGDITSQATVDAEATASGTIVARAAGTVAGLTVVEAVFAHVDPALEYAPSVSDGAAVDAGRRVAGVAGNARSILAAERVALNLLGRLSGIATATRQLVTCVEGMGTAISDTRKTTPGYRALEKLAVRLGGGTNHRFGLYDAVLIKDNHILAAGSVQGAIVSARRAVGHAVTVEVEVESLEQLAEALAAEPDIVMLDNMDIETMRVAVERVGGACIVEASGGITEATVREVAETGVDVISVGWITHSAPSLDFALEFGGLGELMVEADSKGPEGD